MSSGEISQLDPVARASGGEEDPVQQEVLNYPQGSEGGQVSCLGDECDGS